MFPGVAVDLCNVLEWSVGSVPALNPITTQSSRFIPANWTHVSKLKAFNNVHTQAVRQRNTNTLIS